MGKRLMLIIAGSLLIISTQACNLPSSQNHIQPDPPGTITVQTLILPAPASPKETPSPIPVEISIISTTDCRTGPGGEYDLVFTMNQGEIAQVVGKNTPNNYWIIDSPAGGTCWLWGKFAVLNGDISFLPEFQVPPLSITNSVKSSNSTPAPTTAAALQTYLILNGVKQGKGTPTNK